VQRLFFLCLVRVVPSSSLTGTLTCAALLILVWSAPNLLHLDFSVIVPPNIITPSLIWLLALMASRQILIIHGQVYTLS
jgi:hypothetical protein